MFEPDFVKLYILLCDSEEHLIDFLNFLDFIKYTLFKNWGIYSKCTLFEQKSRIMNKVLSRYRQSNFSFRVRIDGSRFAIHVADYGKYNMKNLKRLKSQCKLVYNLFTDPWNKHWVL